MPGQLYAQSQFFERERERLSLKSLEGVVKDRLYSQRREYVDLNLQYLNFLRRTRKNEGKREDAPFTRWKDI